MKNEITTRFINLLLRGLSMGSRFIFLFALAKYISPEALGQFGLMLALVSFSVLIVGADYYIYAHRELLARDQAHWSMILNYHLKAQFFLYLFLLPLQVFYFIFDVMDWRFVTWFYALVLAEHIAQELNRWLIAMQRQVFASLVLFVRMGSWVLVLLPMMYFYPAYASLETIFSFWLAGCLLAIVIGTAKICKISNFKFQLKSDWPWIFKGLKVGGYFLLATLCYRGLLTFDRFYVENLGGSEHVGVYVFYMGVVLGVYRVLEPTVYSFVYPKMLRYYQCGQFKEYKLAFRELVISTGLGVFLFSILIWFMMPYLLEWIGKPVYQQYLPYLKLFIAIGAVLNLGMIPFYALYTMKSDKWIVAARVSSFLIFFISVYFLNLDDAIARVSWSLFVSTIILGMIKLLGFWLTNKHMNNRCMS